MATSATAAYPGSGAGSERVMAISRRIDCAEYADKLTANSVIEAIQLRANTAVMAAGVRVVTASTGTGAAVINLGDGGDRDKYVTAFTAKSVGQESTYDNDTNGAGGVYTTADTIDVQIATAAVDTSLVLDVWAVVVDLNFYETTESIEDSIAVA